MSISGLIIHFLPDAPGRQATLDKLANHPAIDLGQESDHRLPIVVEAANSEESTLIWEWLNSLPGVSLVDVAFLHFEENDNLCSSMEAP